MSHSNHVRRIRPIGLALLLALGVATQASAVAFNIDFGTVFGVPGSTYGAAAGQPGVWNGIDPTDSGPHTLVDINGTLTAITLSISVNEGVFSSNDPSTSGDDQALLDDELDILPSGVGSSATVTISGLPAGDYEVYTYSRDADTPTAEEVSVDVNGVGGQLVTPSSDTFSGFGQGENYALHTVTLAGGQDLSVVVTIVNDPGTDYGMINGLQIVPEPGTGLLLASGLALLARVRRRA